MKTFLGNVRKDATVAGQAGSDATDPYIRSSRFKAGQQIPMLPVIRGNGNIPPVKRQQSPTHINVGGEHIFLEFKAPSRQR